MNRMISNLREMAADLFAAIDAAAAVRAHRQPSGASLRQLGIAERDWVSVRY